MVSEKILKINNGLIVEQSNRGKILNVISSDLELIDLLAMTLYC